MSFYNEIIPNLYLGSVEASTDNDFIQDKKISLIVNCSKDLKNEYSLNLLKPIEEAPLEIQEWLYNNSYYIKYLYILKIVKIKLNKVYVYKIYILHK